MTTYQFRDKPPGKLRPGVAPIPTVGYPGQLRCTHILIFVSDEMQKVWCVIDIESLLTSWA